ncbi:MAG: hypothetical protein JWO82_4305 [Akkermansiaceae bacterium]|nr:hypothetical protein [Akkermansiaceae bacterium]
MNHTYLKALATAGATALLALNSASAATITFDELPLGSGGYWNGSTAPAGGPTSQGATFHNDYTASFDSWSGFAYSNLGDTTTAGFGNQYSSFAGGGVGGTGNFALAYIFDPAVVTFNGLVDMTGGGASITNTTYAGLSMQNGDSFAKKFGGVSGNDADYFLLTIQGYAGGIATGAAVNFYLADFRFADNSQDYIVKDWTNVDLSPLGQVDEIRFSLSSSDNGNFGMNTPAYFAIDNLTSVPEPSAAVLALAGAAFLRRRRR